MMSGVRSAPTPTPRAATLSSTPKTRARTLAGAIRAMRVKPPTSTRALPAPTIASMTIADVAEGKSPMTTRGAPHRATPSPNQAASRPVPTRSAAAADATTAPAPRAALSTPDAGVPEPHELHRDDDREDRDGATHDGLGADQGEQQPQVPVGVHRADPAQGPVQRALGIGCGVAERGRFRMHPGHQPPGPRRRDGRHGEHLGRPARWRAGPR